MTDDKNSAGTAPEPATASTITSEAPQTLTSAELLDHDALEDSPVRVFGYFARVGRLLGQGFSKGARYVAFSSDVGESFRPVVDARYVRAGYGIAGAYIVGDIAYNGYLADKEGRNVSRAVAHTATFQMLGSILVPSLIIHTSVHQAQKAFQRVGRFTKWGPVFTGLAIIPLLPLTVDEPIEHLVDLAFEKAWPLTAEEIAKINANLDKKNH